MIGNYGPKAGVLAGLREEAGAVRQRWCEGLAPGTCARLPGCGRAGSCGSQRRGRGGAVSSVGAAASSGWGLGPGRAPTVLLVQPVRKGL